MDKSECIDVIEILRNQVDGLWRSCMNEITDEEQDKIHKILNILEE